MHEVFKGKFTPFFIIYQGTQRSQNKKLHRRWAFLGFFQV